MTTDVTLAGDRFEITVDGRTIPFPTLFTALATGQGRLMLPDRTYFSLDNPVFDRLRELIGEGEALAEWNPHQQQVSRYQVDMWEDITAIAEEARASAEWERSVGALARLTEITAPPLPAALTATLRPYQEEGLAWLAFLLEHGLGGVERVLGHGDHRIDAAGQQLDGPRDGHAGGDAVGERIGSGRVDRGAGPPGAQQAVVG